MTLVRILALGVLVAFLAACGAAKTPAVASLGTTTTQTASSIVPRDGSFLKFVSCMRAHGVQVQLGPGGQGVVISGGDPNSPQFRQAQAACQKYLPGGGPKPLTAAQQEQQLKQLVKLAKCMRSHGVSNFPDPSANGASGFPFAGIKNEVGTPQFEKAAKACGAVGPNGNGFGVKVHA